MLRSWMPGYDIIEPYENAIPETFSREYQKMIDSRACGDVQPPILQVRDYLNWGASFIKLFINEPDNVKGAKYAEPYADYWLAIAKEANNHTSFFKEKQVIFYDRFVKDKRCRQEICESVGGIYNEDRLGYVPNNGRFSSFDGRDKQGRGYEMDVTNRYKWFMTNDGARFIKYMAMNKEALEYYRDHFELNTEKEELTEKLLLTKT